MENYALKSIQCCKCFQKTLIETSHSCPCPNCGSSLNPKPRPARVHSEKKAISKPSKPLHSQKPRAKEEEKKKPAKKIKAEKKTPKETRQSLKPKTKDLAPQAKRPKKKKTIKKHQNSPEDPVYIDFFSDDLANSNYFSDSFEEYYVDSPVFGFNPVYTTQFSNHNQIDRRSLNRVSQNLFNLFFDGFAEIEYVPHLSAFQNDSEIWSISHLLRNLVAMHPDHSTPTDPEIVSSIPIIRVTEAIKKQCSTCTICQEELKISEQVKKLRCGHLYHGDCIDPWLSARNTCPVCREVIC